MREARLLLLFALWRAGRIINHLGAVKPGWQELGWLLRWINRMRHWVLGVSSPISLSSCHPSSPGCPAGMRKAPSAGELVSEVCVEHDGAEPRAASGTRSCPAHVGAGGGEQGSALPVAVLALAAPSHTLYSCP